MFLQLPVWQQITILVLAVGIALFFKCLLIIVGLVEVHLFRWAWTGQRVSTIWKRWCDAFPAELVVGSRERASGTYRCTWPRVSTRQEIGSLRKAHATSARTCSSGLSPSAC